MLVSSLNSLLVTIRFALMFAKLVLLISLLNWSALSKQIARRFTKFIIKDDLRPMANHISEKERNNGIRAEIDE